MSTGTLIGSPSFCELVLLTCDSDPGEWLEINDCLKEEVIRNGGVIKTNQGVTLGIQCLFTSAKQDFSRDKYYRTLQKREES